MITPIDSYHALAQPGRLCENQRDAARPLAAFTESTRDTMVMGPCDEARPDPTAADVRVLPVAATAAGTSMPKRVPTIAGVPEAELDAWVARKQRTRVVLDWLLVVLVVVLAIGLASVPIRNSDVWLHLAAGRNITTSSSSAFSDPFTHTAVGPVANPTWLYDVVCYGVYAAAGATGLAIAMAVAVALLAGVMVYSGCRGATSWMAAVCTALALLTIAPWLRLQPQLCSLVFLALTIGFLERRTAPHDQGAALSPSRSWISYWPLFLLLAAWANTDPWFLVGVIALTCYWLGGQVTAGQARRNRVPILAVFVGWAVCLLNPRGYHAFAIPADVVLVLHYPSLAEEPTFAAYFLSPMRSEFYSAGAGWYAAYAGIGLLLGLGALALVFNRAGRHLPRLLVCSALLGVALIQGRQIPYLAVALAGCVPLAWHEIATARVHDRLTTALRLRQGLNIRLATIGAALAVVALAWIGRLQPGQPQPRGWALVADPSLMHAAEELAAWRRDGRLAADAIGFNLSPEVADYCAWLCPDEKGFVNSRLETSIGAALDFALVRRGLSEVVPTVTNVSGMGRPADWRAVLRRRHIDHVVLADRDPERMQAVLYRVLATPSEWHAQVQAGRVLVLSWHDPQAQATEPLRGTGLDLARDGLDGSDKRMAPAGPAAHGPTAPAWWESLLPVADEPSLDQDEAALRMMVFEALRGPTARQQAHVWESFLAGCSTGQAIGGDVPGAVMRMEWLQMSMALPPGSPDQAGQPSFSERLRARFLSQRDEAPIGQLIAGVRACRRVLAAHPDDARAYLLLGQLYCRLAWQTSERVWGKRLAALGEVRLLQAINALQHALRLNPNLDQAHGLLVSLYQQSGSVERALRHLRTFQTIQRARGPAKGETAAQCVERLNRLDAELVQLERQVFDRESDVERLPPGSRLADRARVASRLGLADSALQMLEGADVETAGTDELYTAMQLLLSAGRAPEAQALLKSDHQALFGEVNYYWLAARIDMANGDYAGADAHLAKLAVRAITLPELQLTSVDLEVGLAVAVAKHVLAALRQSASIAHLPLAAGTFEPQRVQNLSRMLEQTAEFAIVQGVLALEHGERNRALVFFRQAARLSQHDPDRGVRPIAAYYLRLLARNGT